jgi:hypothetical protein
MTLQYFEGIEDQVCQPSTKYIFPMEFTSLISDLVRAVSPKD